MSIKCVNLLSELVEAVDDVNRDISLRMTQTDVDFESVCVRTDINYERYYELLKIKWENIINNFINDTDSCGFDIKNLLFMYELKKNINNANIRKKIEEGISHARDGDMEGYAKKIMLENAYRMIMKDKRISYTLSKDASKSLINLGNIFSENCQCHMIDIFSYILERYNPQLKNLIKGKSKSDVMMMVEGKYQDMVDILRDNKISAVSKKISFSIEDELKNIIPDELGSMKDFFITVISTYYNNLHPIVWAQIFRGMVENIFTELPTTYDDFFSFASKQVLLNSGPFILKVLQMIRPAMTDELAAKYNLTKLTYPLLDNETLHKILKKATVDYNMYKFVRNVSASVGHIAIGYNVKEPHEKFVVKIIKPLAIAQSCWEYKTLYDVFDENTCERDFVRNMMKSNGYEMNVNNEIMNLHLGHKYYSANYKDTFDADIEAYLSTIEHKEGIVRDGYWNVMAMTLAPGIPISKLVESNLLSSDTKYRAKLHRCLDLLVERFFYNIVNNGFYHGDLHAGNAFFSYKEKQITLIDFGAVGEIDVYSGDESVKVLLDIVIMSLFYNYDEILDIFTEMLNNKCHDGRIDKNSQKYKNFKNKLLKYKIRNAINSKKEKHRSKTYVTDVFSDKRLEDEKNQGQQISNNNKQMPKEDDGDSIYSYLEWKDSGPEPIIENRDTLPRFTEVVGDGQNVTFAKVMEEIITFYAQSGVNVAIKFADFYEFQKAYALLLGVLTQTGYSSYRMNMAVRKGIVNWGNLPSVFKVKTSFSVMKMYRSESKKYDDLLNYINKMKEKYRDRLQ